VTSTGHDTPGHRNLCPGHDIRFNGHGKLDSGHDQFFDPNNPSLVPWGISE